MNKFYLCKLCVIVFGALLAVQSVFAGWLADITWEKGDILKPITAAKEIQFDETVPALVSKGFSCNEPSGQYGYCELKHQTMTILGQPAEVSINLENDRITDITFRIEADVMEVKEVMMEALGKPFYAAISATGKPIPYMTGGVYWIAQNLAVIQPREDLKDPEFTDVIFTTPLRNSNKNGREFFRDIGAGILVPETKLDSSDL